LGTEVLRRKLRGGLLQPGKGETPQRIEKRRRKKNRIFEKVRGRDRGRKGEKKGQGEEGERRGRESGEMTKGNGRITGGSHDPSRPRLKTNPIRVVSGGRVVLF